MGPRFREDDDKSQVNGSTPQPERNQANTGSNKILIRYPQKNFLE